MSTFWKGFGIFWIIFLIWYLTGGPQRVTNGGATPTTTFDSSGVGAIATSSENNNDSTYNIETQTKSEKSFPNQPKTNTINVSN
ncbi:MAG: hypothetical protein QG630_205 [Patescibacteria group bacterium]|nr:hypothetical protein [Patescibacteria group bacterium]